MLQLPRNKRLDADDKLTHIRLIRKQDLNEFDQFRKCLGMDLETTDYRHDNLK